MPLKPLCAPTLVFNSSEPTQSLTTHLSAAQTTMQRAGWLFAQDKRGRTIRKYLPSISARSGKFALLCTGAAGQSEKVSRSSLILDNVGEENKTARPVGGMDLSQSKKVTNRPAPKFIETKTRTQTRVKAEQIRIQK